jgi:hypothetical protein
MDKMYAILQHTRTIVMNRRLIVCVMWCEEILILGTRQAS